MHYKYWILSAATLLLCACNGSLREEEVVYDSGVYTECGEGEGLSPCHDYTGYTYDEEASDSPLVGDTNEELAEEAELMRESQEVVR